MVDAGRTAAGWLTGRVILFLVALVVLVAAGVMGDRTSAMRSAVDAVVPDAELVRGLKEQQAVVRQALEREHAALNARLGAAHSQSRAAILERVAALDDELGARRQRRPGPAEQAIAFATGTGVGELVENEARIQMLVAEREALIELVDAMGRAGMDPGARRQEFEAARADFAERRATYRRLDAELTAYEQAHPTARVPFELAGLPNATRATYLSMLARRNQAVRDYNAAHARLEKARHALGAGGPNGLRPLAPIAMPDVPLLAQFDTFVAEKTARVELTKRRLAELRDRAARTAWQAFWIVVAISLLPLLLKAFWYYVMAPLAARRPPIRLEAAGTLPVTLPALSPGVEHVRKFSAVSQELVLAEGDELLVHPEFIQSLSHAGAKRTQWLLSRSLPLTSLASGLVGLTRVIGAGATCTVASKKDPFAEVGIVDIPAGASMVMQPRALVGLVQPTARPVRIVPRWNIGFGALVTLQFRYLVFQGPARLVVAGCRGVRQEPAGSGRSIDQNQTVGFSANLDYAPRRSETFGAYLLGVNGLFNDSFAGGPGIYVYEEMPYSGRRTGITGRGLEGVTDVLLKLFGI